MKAAPTVKIELTPEQKEQIAQATGKQVPVVELKLEVLEARLAPMPGVDFN